MVLIEVTLSIEVQQLLFCIQRIEHLDEGILNLIEICLALLLLILIKVLIKVGPNANILGAHFNQELIRGSRFDRAHQVLNRVTVRQRVIGEGVDLVRGDNEDNVLGHGQLVKLDHVALPLANDVVVFFILILISQNFNNLFGEFEVVN